MATPVPNAGKSGKLCREKWRRPYKTPVSREPVSREMTTPVPNAGTPGNCVARKCIDQLQFEIKLLEQQVMP